MASSMTAREVMTRKPGGTARLLSWETGRQGAVEQRSAGIYACRTAWGSADCALRVQAVPGMESSGIRLEFAGERETDGSNEPLPAAPPRGL